MTQPVHQQHQYHKDLLGDYVMNVEEKENLQKKKNK